MPFAVFRPVSRLFVLHVGGPVAEVEGPVAEAIDADGDGASDASRIFVPLTVWPRGAEFGDERETLENLHFPRDQLFIVLRGEPDAAQRRVVGISPSDARLNRATCPLPKSTDCGK